ncbi:MAG: hypothetical protein JWO36_3611 [Myxococcales bacterium]|nr:hypothetical protein [Myxococcales bacterium]
MREHRVTLPELVLIAATRGMIGFGAGLLLSERFSGRSGGRRRRRVIGWSLLATGLVSTIPLVLRLRRRGQEREELGEQRMQPEEPMPEDSQAAAVIMAE